MTRSAKAKAPAETARETYHHGNLRAAMIAAAVQVVEESGVENLTVREAARRAGVSSGAPFRHFAGRAELVTAVAEDAMAKLRAAIELGLARLSAEDPFVRLLAIADAYIHWAVRHPTHYRVLGDRPLVDFYASAALVRDNLWIRQQMREPLQTAEDNGLLRPCDLNVITLQCRALAYGLARMHVDGHFREFGIAKKDARAAMVNALKEFIVAIARDPARARQRLG